MRFIIDLPRRAAWNMALDEALLYSSSKSGETILRLYRWEPASVSLGYFQRWQTAVEPETCKKLGVDMVRRPTGGRAILHDIELTYALIMPTGSAKLLDSFKKINQAFLEGLRILGVKAELLPRSKTAKAPSGGKMPVCFASPSSYELLVEGKKLLGSAQMRKDGTLLQHGSLPLVLDRDKLYNCLYFPDPETRERELEKSFSLMTSITEARKLETGWEETARAIVEGFSRSWQTPMTPGEFSREEISQAEELVNQKYLTPEWNFAR